MEKKSHFSEAATIASGFAFLPPLNALRSFEAVARRGSFAAAASDMNVTHWAVGKQIRLLEDWFGTPLFERRARGVQLTEEGAVLLQDVSTAFERLSSGAARLRQGGTVRRVSGVVRVNVLVSFALSWLLPRLPAFQTQYPGIEVKVSTTSRRLRYIGDAFDVGVRSGHEQSAGLLSSTLFPDLRLPACSPALLRQQPIRRVEDLRNHTLLHSASTRGSWNDWLGEAGAPSLRISRKVEFEHVFLQQAAAVEGLGVALVSLPLIRRELAAGRLVCPFAGLVWRAPDYALVVNVERAQDDAVAIFRRWIEGEARQEPVPSWTD